MEAIEFHDSVLMRIDRAGDELHLLFDAYVHRSSGEPGVDPGTGWTVDVELILSGAESRSIVPKLPASIWDGSLRIDESEFSNVVPLPFQAMANIALRIELMSGEIVEATATRAQLLVAGPYTFVENLSFGRSPR
jgi:hypothetical protein